MPEKMSSYDVLSRRERQIMNIVYRLGHVSAVDVARHLADPPSDSAIRTHLKILVDKGHLKRGYDGSRRIYTPTVARAKVASSALHGLLRNFFGNSREKLFAALLDDPGTDVTREELGRLAKLIEVAREEGR